MKKLSINQEYIKNIVKKALAEDLYPYGDITSKQIKKKEKIRTKIISNQNCIVGGINFAKIPALAKAFTPNVPATNPPIPKAATLSPDLKSVCFDPSVNSTISPA